MIQVAQERPPYVVFEIRAIEDREATLASGHFVAKDVDYAIITPAGSKDRIERVADEWFKKLEDDLRNERINPQWVTHFRESYKAWKAGMELPETGTPIVRWPAVSPAQVAALLNANVRTVEDLAAANESTITQIGMGGRSLKQRAEAWLQSSADTGKVAEEVASLRQAKEELKTQNEALLKRLAALEAASKTQTKEVKM